MSIDLPGFADPVAQSQACFRAVLEAMSRPGSRHAAGAGLLPPRPLGPAMAAVLLSLVDSETRLWLAPEFAAATDWIAFHCGATPTAEIGAADFVVAAALPDLKALASGSDEAPENSATVLLEVAGFDGGPPLMLSGPGLRVPRRLAVPGLPEDFADRWAANHALFPRGIDLVLCATNELVALPRSLAIVAGEI